MSWFRRDRDEPSPESADDEGTEPVTEVTTRALGANERATLDRAIARAAALGIDVSDVASIAACADRLVGAGSADSTREDIDAIAAAIGEHLASTGAYLWVVVTDPFGTDVGLEAARGSATVIPTNLVAGRWMRAETGWVEPVVAQLLRRANR